MLASSRVAQLASLVTYGALLNAIALQPSLRSLVSFSNLNSFHNMAIYRCSSNGVHQVTGARLTPSQVSRASPPAVTIWHGYLQRRSPVSTTREVVSRAQGAQLPRRTAPVAPYPPGYRTRRLACSFGYTRPPFVLYGTLWTSPLPGFLTLYSMPASPISRCSRRSSAIHPESWRTCRSAFLGATQLRARCGQITAPLLRTFGDRDLVLLVFVGIHPRSCRPQ